jgi:spore coat protein U-like protein
MASQHFALRVMLAAVAALCVPGAASAQSITSSLVVNTVVVQPACTVKATALNPTTSYSASSSGISGASAIIDVNCSPALANPVTVQIQASPNASNIPLCGSSECVCGQTPAAKRGGQPTPINCSRAMSDGNGHYLAYDLFQTCSTGSPCYIQLLPSVPLPLAPGAVGVTAYMSIPPGQTTAPGGSYSDVLQVTVNP